MRILYHHRTAALDGMSVHIDRLVSALRARGHEVHVVGPGSGKVEAGGRHGGLEKLSDSLRALLPSAAFEFLELAYNIPAYRRLKREAKAFRPDVLYERNNLYLLAGLRLKRKLGLPMLLEINAPLLDERVRFGKLSLRSIARRAERALWGGADVALPVSRVLADMVAKIRGNRDMHVIHNGADLETPEPADDVRARFGLNGKVVLGFVGFVRPWHGLEWAIRALPRLGPDVHLLVVGDGPAQQGLEEEAAALGVKDRVHFAGRIPHQEISAFVQSFDVALQTKAVGYCSPLKMFEYMALSRAIIAPDQPNLREILKHDIDALLFDPKDEASFFSALQRLSADAPLRARLGGAARRSIVETPFTWAENARRVEELAQGLLSARRKTG